MQYIKKILKNDKKYVRKWTRQEKILFSIIASIFIGLLIGIIICFRVDISEYNNLSNYINLFVNSLDIIEFDKKEAFFECILKYGKIPVIIWILAFLPPGVLIVYIILFIKGLSLGFTTTFLVREFKFKGFLYALKLYIPQNIILIFCYIFISYASFNFVISNVKLNKNKKSDHKKTFKFKDLLGSSIQFEMESFLEYFKSICFAMFLIIVVSLIECFLILSIY